MMVLSKWFEDNIPLSFWWNSFINGFKKTYSWSKNVFLSRIEALKTSIYFYYKRKSAIIISKK